VESLRGVRGYDYLGFRLTDDTGAGQSRVITEVRTYLTGQTGTDPITALPTTRAPGQWPGKSGFDEIIALRRPVAETLAGTATSGFGSGRLDRLVARSGLLARTGVPGGVRMGVRNALRQKRRSAATIAQVAVGPAPPPSTFRRRSSPRP
jgi:hypothetical protein